MAFKDQPGELKIISSHGGSFPFDRSEREAHPGVLSNRSGSGVLIFVSPCLSIRYAIIKIVTGLSNGQISVLYSPTSSLNGAKLPLSKGPPRKVTIEDMSDALAQPAIITPHALPMFREGEIARGTGKRRREKERLDPRKSRRPELPVTGPGKGGRVGASATQHVVQNLVKDTTREEDVRGQFLSLPSVVERSADYHLPSCVPGPCSIRSYTLASTVRYSCRVFCDRCYPWQPREALLRHAKSAEQNPRWTAGKRCPGSAVALVCSCLFGHGDADSFFLPPSAARRPSLPLPYCSF